MSDDEINFPRLLKNGIKVGKKFPKRGGGCGGGEIMMHRI